MDNKRITKVYLLSTPLESDYKHTLYFNSKSGQETYFKSKVVKEYTNFSYQRKDGYIRVPEHFDNLQNVNYVMYQNSAYSNKWFYAFITDIKYIDDGRTDIYIETDVIQTWYFDYTVKPSFVEREHVSNDTVGLHTVPEQLETGDYIVNSINKNEALTDHVIIMASNIDPSLDSNDKLIGGAVAGGTYNGVPTGYKYYSFLNSSTSKLEKVLKAFADEGKMDAIGMMFMAPLYLIETSEDGIDNTLIKQSYQPKLMEWDQDETRDTPNYKLTTLNGYTPRNKKLLTYPYCYMNMSNNNGGHAIYKYELFDVPDNVDRQDLCPFQIYGSLTPSMDIMLVPSYYNGVTGANFEESLSGGKLPICGWASDVYTNWLTQNAINIATSFVNGAYEVAKGGAMIGVGVATGGVGGLGIGMSGVDSAMGGATQIAGTVSEIYQHKLVPIQAQGNTNTGNVKFASKNTTFTAYNMSIKKEYAEIIDKYFDMFGYKVNVVKTPNIHHRSRWWYTKTIDVNIDGAIPMNDMAKIKACYNTGITFWRNGSEIGNYSLSNSINNAV